jgi:hypothetical protein
MFQDGEELILNFYTWYDRLLIPHLNMREFNLGADG